MKPEQEPEHQPEMKPEPEIEPEQELEIEPEPEQEPEIEQESEMEPELELLETLTNLCFTIQGGEQRLKDLIHRALLIPERTIMQFLLSQD